MVGDENAEYAETRRGLGGGTALIAVPAAAQNNAQPPQPHGNVADLKVTDKDYTLGPKDAKIVLVEYASLTCSHCAQFHTQVLPGLKKEFIDTGKIRYIYRDFPLDRLALGAAMIAQCSGRDTFFGFIETFWIAVKLGARIQPCAGAGKTCPARRNVPERV